MKKGIEIKKDVYWVGVHDNNLRHFHGSLFPIEDGTTYNAYLIVDEQVTLIDTVEEEFVEEMFERIESIIGDRPINNLIVQHAEPDHSGGFKKLMKKYPDCKPYASNIGISNMLKQFFGDYEFTKIKTDDELSIGKYTLSFLEMQLIHWPDNMLTYLKEHKLAFSNDAFGQHIVSYNMFDDCHSLDLSLDKAKDYYANILIPYGKQIAAKLAIIKKMDIDMIAPAHGIVWRSHVKDVIALYDKHSQHINEDKVTIVYESVWTHTQQIAEALAEGLAQSGLEVKLYKKSITSSALILKDILDSKAVMIGSGCYNNFMSEEIAGFLEKLKSCKIEDKSALGFGAYGWYMNTAANIEIKLKEANFEVLEDTARLSKNFTPSCEAVNEIINFAYELGLKIKEQ